jgi:HSP20 family molecular chaperone IbpA
MSTLSLWTRRDPYRDVFSDFDAIVGAAFAPFERGRWAFPARPNAEFVPAAEVSRDGEDAVVKLELPGLDVAKDVTVELDRGELVVRGERRDERTSAEDGRTVREVRYGQFRRGFTVPAHVTSESISADYAAGVLTVRVTGAYAGTGAQRIAVTAGTAPATPAVEAGEPGETSEQPQD